MNMPNPSQIKARIKARANRHPWWGMLLGFLLASGLSAAAVALFGYWSGWRDMEQRVQTHGMVLDWTECGQRGWGRPVVIFADQQGRQATLSASRCTRVRDQFGERVQVAYLPANPAESARLVSDVWHMPQRALLGSVVAFVLALLVLLAPSLLRFCQRVRARTPVSSSLPGEGG